MRQPGENDHARATLLEIEGFFLLGDYRRAIGLTYTNADGPTFKRRWRYWMLRAIGEYLDGNETEGDYARTEGRGLANWDERLFVLTFRKAINARRSRPTLLERLADRFWPQHPLRSRQALERCEQLCSDFGQHLTT